jgi:hypothetical protein
VVLLCEWEATLEGMLPLPLPPALNLKGIEARMYYSSFKSFGIVDDIFFNLRVGLMKYLCWSVRIAYRSRPRFFLDL